MTAERQPWTARVVAVFLRGHLPPLLILMSLVAGAAALWLTPREEEPQIVVPAADVLVDVPGSDALEVERQVATRLEKLLFQVDGVEYVYSRSRADRCVVTVRFFVGEDREDSLLKLHDQLRSHADRIPPQVAGWVVRPVEVDDVAILAVTLYSDRYDDHALRRLAEEMELRLQAVPDVGRTEVLGGRPREVRVLADPEALAARGLTLRDVGRALRGAVGRAAGAGFQRGDREVLVRVGDGGGTERLDDLVVGTSRGRPVHLRDVAVLRDGPAERATFTRIGFAPGAGVPERYRDPGRDFPAVTVAVAKRKGANAVWVARDVRAEVGRLERGLLPGGVDVRITRDHGHTADEKVGELIEGLWVAVVIVVALLAAVLGWREALVVATAIPLTFALTLLVNHLSGYSINRVTMFALILALGLVVDDPIVDVENIHRHLRMKREKPFTAVLNAVNEVRPPIILATLAVIVSFLPLFFITGMMGPYMAPMALNVPLAMLMSLVVAFTVTPWLAWLALRRKAARAAEASPPGEDETAPPGIRRAYAGIMGPLLRRRGLRSAVLGGTAVLFAASGWLALSRTVPLKMLPYDNKDELQVVLDLPEGTTLERTEAVAAEMAAVCRGLPETLDVTSYVGLTSPEDFNGMVRRDSLRRAPHLADLRLNLVAKRKREAQSHAVALRLRAALAPIADRHGAALKVVESPPGPPVLATVTAEVYGPEHLGYGELTAAARALADRLGREPGAVDVDHSGEAPQREWHFHLDREKAALHGIDEAAVADLLHTAVDGRRVVVLHAEREVDPLAVRVRLPRPRRSSRTDLEQLPVRAATGEVLRLGELGRFVRSTRTETLHRKNLRRVAYVFAEVAGRAPAEVILDVKADRVPAATPRPPAAPRPVAERTYFANGGGMPWSLAEGIEIDWRGEGEWKITLDVFRDLGLAFLAACIGIYALLVHETGSYVLPLVLMLSIPFTVIGILPGFWLLNLVAAGEVAGAADPVFFTATAMIGMIALAGIAVRNAILLMEFLRKAEDEGRPLHDAVLEAGAVRIRPILLTAGTAMLAALPITLDPVFSGLAWALIFGLLVSSAFTLVLVPLVYTMLPARSRGQRPVAA